MISGASIDRCVRILLTTFYHMHHYTVQLLGRWSRVHINFKSPTAPSYYNKLTNIMSSFSLSQIVTKPTPITTTASTLIDLAFTSTQRMVHQCETVPPLANSDHLGIQLVLSVKLCKNIHKPLTRKIWQYNIANFDQ